MSNVNNFVFAKNLDNFKVKILDPQIKRVAEAEAIMSDPNHKWDNDEQQKASRAKYDSYKAWKTLYQLHYDEGLKLCIQHEQLVNNLSKWYDCWYENISNDGKQETELMSSQADMLQEIFVAIYPELKPLGLQGMKMPKGLNL
jgi:hypothetical protein